MKRVIMPSVFVLLLVATLILDGCYADNIEDLSTFKFQFPVPFGSVHWDRAAPDTSYDFSNLYEYKEYRDNEDRVKKAEILHFNYWIDDLIYRNVNDTSEILAFEINENNERVSYMLTHVEEDSLQWAEDKNAMIDLDRLFARDNNGNPIQKDVDIAFHFIKFYLIFADWKGPGPYDPMQTNEKYWTMQRDNEGNPVEYELGTFENVDLKSAFRFPDRDPNQQGGDMQHHIEWVPAETAKIISAALKDNPQFYIKTEYSPVVGQVWPHPDNEKYYFPLVSARYDLVIRFEVEL